MQNSTHCQCVNSKNEKRENSPSRLHFEIQEHVTKILCPRSLFKLDGKSKPRTSANSRVAIIARSTCGICNQRERRDGIARRGKGSFLYPGRSTWSAINSIRTPWLLYCTVANLLPLGFNVPSVQCTSISCSDACRVNGTS